MRNWLAVAVAIAGSTEARAQNVDNVNQGTSYLTIQAAIDDADPGDTLELIAAAFDEEVAVTKDVTVFGNGFTTLSSPGVVVFDLAADVSFDLSGVIVEPVAGDLDLRGITADLGGNSIGISNATFVTADPAGDGPALRVYRPVDMSVTNVMFLAADPGASSAGYGGAIRIDALLVPISFTDVVFSGLVASYLGGAIYADGGVVTCAGCTFDHTAASYSGGAIAIQTGGLTVDNGTFCSVVSGGVDGGGAVHAEIGDITIRSSRFVECGMVGEAGAVLADPETNWIVTNNTFVGNGGIGAVNFFDSVTSVTATNNLFYASDGFAIVFADSFPPTPTITYNSFDANALGDVSGRTIDGTNQFGPPGLTAWSQNSNCDDDQLWPLPTSGLIDAGDPAILDPDGSRSDIGAYGGPFADPAFHEDDDGDGFTFVRDCDDDDPTAFPDAPESCDAIDNDCDGLVDDLDPDIVGQDTFYPDCDSDGQGAGASVTQCFAPATQPPCGTGTWVSVASLGVLASSDCDDTDPLAHVDADELCAPGDQNCDGDDDLGAIDPTPYYVDSDIDGYGSATQVSVCGEAPPLGYSILTGDCDDSEPNINPGAPDPCGDGVDQDCNDADGDDAAIQEWTADADGDGYGDLEAVPVLDCGEVPGSATVATDCDDSNPDVHPGATEACNGVDDDCVGGIDDGFESCEEPVTTTVRPIGACSSTDGTARWLLLAVVLLVRRRDRSR